MSADAGPDETKPAPRPAWAEPLFVRDASSEPVGPGRSAAEFPPAPWTTASASTSAIPFPPAPASASSPQSPRAPPSSCSPVSRGKVVFADDVAARSGLGWFRDNLEAFAFAILLALLLRHLCVEVFKIPTSSMEPTLFGDHSSRHPKTAGDRIIVEKTAYVFHGPERWDVAVFRFPLDWTRNFIKRVAGLPGESLRIVRGDLWVAKTPSDDRPPTYHPARKPKRVRDQLYASLYPPRTSDASRLPSWYWRDETVGGSGWKPLASFAEFAFAGDVEARVGVPVPAAILAYGYLIRDTSETSSDPSTSDGFATPDIRVRGTITTHGPADVLLEWHPGDGRVHAMRLATAGRGASLASTARGNRALPALPETGATAFEFESVDGDLRVAIDGEEVAVLPDEITLEKAELAAEPSDPQRLTFSVRGSPLELRDVTVAHDLYYTSEGRPETGDAWRIPDDAYFMLGDNTRNSNDSRRWSASGVRLADGREIWFDPSPSADEEPRYPRYETIDGVSYEERRDTEGVVRRWAPGDLMPGSGSLSRRMPFVERERIVGRAWFAMYADVDAWPLKIPKITTSGRIRFIH